MKSKKAVPLIKWQSSLYFYAMAILVTSEFIAFSAVVVSTVKSRCQRAKNFAVEL